MNRLLLVDGNSMLFRAYYATAYTNMMRTSYGKHTNAVFAFDRMIKNALDLIEPDHVLVAFDTKEPTFRHEMFDDYKGTRSKAPDELVEQFETVRELIDAMGLARYEEAGYEADDIIGSMAHKYQDTDVVILTSDQDMLQLVSENTEVLLMKKGISEMETVNLENFEENYEVRPDQIVDLKALMGDSADNIPGVPGIGKVIGTRLIKRFDTLENLLNNTDQLKGKQKENVENNIESAKLSKVLATIKTDMEIDLNENDFKFEFDYPTMYDFYQEYEMNQVAESIREHINGEVKHHAEFKVVNQISPSMMVKDASIWFETTGSYHDSKIDYLWIGNTEQAEMIAFDDFIQDQELLKFLASDVDKVVYDSKFIMHTLNQLDLTINGIKEDLMLAAFLVDNSVTDWVSYHNKYGLSISDMQQEETVVEDIANKAFNLFKPLTTIQEEIKEFEMQYLYYEVELPLAKVLFKMEVDGIAVSYDIIKEIADKTEKIIEDVSQEIYELGGKEFNINSPKQLSEILFDELELPQIKKRSTAIDVLEKLEDKHPIIPLIMKQRKYQKLFSTYADGLQKFITDDGRIHTTYHQNITQTGRLSSTDPNLQNISVRDEDSREIRKAFVADENSVLMAYDYSQVELRILAHMADEPRLIEAFNKNVDIHNQTAIDVLHLDADQVDAEARRRAKAVNFGIVYGISDFGLGEQLEIGRNEAKQYIDNYFTSYPKIKDFMDDAIEKCKVDGYVSTLIGRRREIAEIHSKNYMVRQFGERAAMNAPIQGSAADLIKIAMVRIDEAIVEKGLQSKMILQVHDELIFNVVEDELEVMQALIEEIMENALELKVPLIAEGSYGKDWYDL